MTRQIKKVLYVHHGSGQGGAPNSLLYLLNNLDRSLYEPIVACGFKEPFAKDFFENAGYFPIELPIARFSHFTSGYWELYSLRGIRSIFTWLINYYKSRRVFKKHLIELSPDIVHLNSLSLAPLAFVAKKMGFPVVLHIRETAIKLHKFDIRWYWIRRIANKYVDKIIYICKYNQEKFTGETSNSTVIYNPIPFEKFDKNIDGKKIRQELRIPLGAQVLFFPGGSSLWAKGIVPFLKAVSKFKDDQNKIVALIPNINNNIKVNQIIKDLDIEDLIIRPPFTNLVENYFAASDIVVTPFIAPHFSRAAIEAGAMAKPVIGSKIGGIEEVIING
ncbi:MAG: glycosyltransferase, partial [Melioribacteraceae bacterium]